MKPKIGNQDNAVYLDLFAGCGGFFQAFRKAGYRIKKHYFSEVDKHAIANYTYNFREAEYIGPVESILKRNIERPNIITFGSPCQDFSVAGQGLGLEGEKSSLIRYAIESIRFFKPELFIWENVKGVFSSNDGEDFWAVIKAFADIGDYRLEWQLLNTSWFLPQNRERIYLVGHLAGTGESQVFPIEEESGISNKRYAEKQIASALLSGESSHIANGEYKGMNLIATINSSREVKSGNSPAITARVRNDGSGMPVIKVKSATKAVLTPDRSNKRQNGRRFKEENEPAFTVTGQDQHGVLIDSDIRRLTEIECERLQGFPDDWTKYGLYDGKKKEIPSTQRYKLIGNAVTVDVVEAIARRVYYNKQS